MNQEQRDTIERLKQHAQRRIWVTFQKEGIHFYPAAATDPALKTGDEYDVSFLGAPHRHIFHFRAARYPGRSVWIEVSEDGENGALIKYETHRPSLSVNI